MFRIGLGVCLVIMEEGQNCKHFETMSHAGPNVQDEAVGIGDKTE